MVKSLYSEYDHHAKKIYWTAENTPLISSLDKLLYDIRRDDDSDNINDLAQKIIAAGDIVVASNDAIVAGAVVKWNSLDFAALG